MHSFREVKCLQGYSKTLRMGNVRISPLVVEYNVVVISARLNPMGNQFSIPLLWNLCSESVRHKILRPVEDSDTGGPSSIFVRMKYLLAFQYWCCELCVEKRWRRGRKHCFVNFCFLAVLESSMDKGWWGGAESLI